MQNEEDKVLYLGRTNYRTTNTLFGMKQADRLLHTYIIGKTGTGKTTLLEHMILQDIQQGRGVCLLDPHGDLVTRIMNAIPEHRKDDVIYMDITDPAQPYKYNPLRKVSFETRAIIVSSILEVFKKLWSDSKGWGVKLEHIMRYTLLALLDQPSADFADIGRMLYDRSFRQKALTHIIDDEAKAFWNKEFPRYMYNDILPVLNKVGGMLAYPAIKRVIIDNQREISLRNIIDTKKIFLVNLSKGIIGNDACQILGSLLLTSLASAAFSRATIEEELRVPFYVYLDEFQNFSTLSLINMFSELRKFKLGMTVAHQYTKQLEPGILDAVLGNSGTTISFRVDVHDAALLAKKMFPVFEPIDFINLPNHHIYLSLMIDGVPSKPFSAVTIAPQEKQ